MIIFSIVVVVVVIVISRDIFTSYLYVLNLNTSLRQLKSLQLLLSL